MREIDEPTLLGYLEISIRNRARDAARALRSRGEPTVLDEDVPSRDRDPLEHLLAMERSQELSEALSKLDPHDRGLLDRRYRDGMGYRELALVSGLPSPDAARMAVKRAVTKLLAHL